MERSFEWYRGKISEMISNDADSYEIFYEVDKMFHGEISLPAQLRQLDDIRLIKDSSPHDALYNATVALANSRVRLEVTPLGNAESEFVRANRMEEALGWNWEKANMRGMARKIWDISHSALRYDLVVTRVDDLMFWLPKQKDKWSKANKRAARLGRFLITVIPPHNIHFQHNGITGAFCVLSARNMPLSEVLDYYRTLAGTNKEGQKIKATIKAIEEKIELKEGYEELRFMLYQYTDDDKRLDYGHIMESSEVDDSGGGEDDFVFIDTENKLPFINYTVRGGASEVETSVQHKYHPMLASAYWHESWLNSVLVRSLTFSDIIRRVRETRGTYEGAATDMVPPDDGTGGDKALPPGVTFRRQPPSSIDPQALQVAEAVTGALQQTTSASAMGNLSRYANAAFSTMNAIIQVEMSKLNPQKNIIQDTIADIAYMFCEWVKFTKVPLQAWRSDSTRVKDMEFPKGEEIQISEKDYDLYRLFIKCTINPETPTDQMQRMNIVEKLVQLGMSAEEALEMMNVPHAGLQKDKRSLELLKDGMLQALIAKKNAEGQAEVQLQTAQAQAAIQQQQAQAMAAQQAAQGQQPFAGAGGAGFDPAQGGEPPIEAAPGQGREQMNGAARNGEAIAA